MFFFIPLESAIGTTRQHTGPIYTGCFGFNDLPVVKAKDDGINTPLECLISCRRSGSEFFGLEEMNCFCSTGILDESVAESDNCEVQDGIPSGERQSSLSIFTTATYVQYEAAPRDGQSDICIDLCASGEAGSLCTCDTQPPAKALTMGPGRQTDFSKISDSSNMYP